MSEPLAAGQMAAGIVVAAVTVTTIPADATMVLGIPVDVLLAACAGALFGLAYTKPETWERFMSPIPAKGTAKRSAWIAARVAGLAFTLACNALLAGWVVEIIPHLPMARWTANLAPQPFAGVLAFVGQFTIPRAIQAIDEWRPPWSKPG